ncbi:MAG: TatD family hydrolase [Lachnospirales bacterium]
MTFDSHAHYDDKRFSKDRHDILENLKNKNVGCVVNIGADMKSSRASVKLAESYNFIYATVGVHPHDAKSMTDENLMEIKKLCLNKKVVALGEIGLDYYYDNSPKDKQVFWFKKQLELAKELNMPVVIHSRDADQECFNIIKEAGHYKGIIHCFSGSSELAKEYVKLGFYIGVGGVLTFKNSVKLKKVVEEINLDKIVIETDCPYLAPEPFRGKRNISEYLEYVCKEISNIKETSVEDIEEITWNNAKKVYEIEAF